jgi:hypothetical protein
MTFVVCDMLRLILFLYTIDTAETILWESKKHEEE